MSHLTLAGKRCKVGDKRALCIFHRKSSTSRGRSTVIRSSKTPSITRRTASAVPGYIALPQRERRQIVEEMLRIGEQLNYIPKWGGVRSAGRSGRYGLPRNQYRSRAASRKSGGTGRYTAGKFMRDFNAWMEEMSRKGGFLDAIR